MRLFLSDARYALRRMARSPGFTAVAVLTLALGIGVNTAIFSLIDTVLLRPLPFDEPDRLVRVWAAQPEDGRRFLEATFPEVEALREQNRVFVETAAFSVAPRDLHDAAASPSRIVIARVSAGFFDVVGVGPWIGRDFTDVEYRSGAPSVILGYAFWQSRYGGRVDVLGERIFVQGEPHEVVGVLPKSYHFPHQAVLWRPFTADENQDDDRELQVLARLRPGVGLEQASADVALVFSRREAAAAEGLTGWVQPLHAMLVRDVRTPFWILLAAVAAVLAIACANVANLQLARGTARRQELAIRTALGAGRRRLIHQVLTENLALAAFGGAAGLMLGSWLVRAVVRISPVDLPRLMEVELDVRVAAVMLAVTFVAGLFCGSIPAFQAARGEPASVLHGAHGGVAGSGMRLQQLFVVAQVALATLLAVGAGLLGSTFVQLFHAERGFATESVGVVGLSPPASRDTTEGRIAFYEQMQRALAELPGVEAAALTSFHPMQDDGFHMPFEIAGRAASADQRALARSVTPGFFRAAGIAMRAGRPLEAADTHGVAVVNEAFVRVFLGGSEPLGTSFTHPAYFGDQRPSEHQIVGVVADVSADVSAAAEDLPPVSPAAVAADESAAQLHRRSRRARRRGARAGLGDRRDDPGRRLRHHGAADRSLGGVAAFQHAFGGRVRGSSAAAGGARHLRRGVVLGGSPYPGARPARRARSRLAVDRRAGARARPDAQSRRCRPRPARSRGGDPFPGEPAIRRPAAGAMAVGGGGRGACGRGGRQLVAAGTARFAHRASDSAASGLAVG